MEYGSGMSLRGKKNQEEERMKLIIDNANIDEIRSMYEFFPMDGVTCNPTILAKEKRPPYEVLKEIRDFIEEGELHVQVVSDHADNMVEEAYKIRKELGDDTYIKIPTTKEGLKAIRILAAAGINVTATAIYTQMQAFLAAKAGALYVAPYINRIDNLGSDGVRAQPRRFTICSAITSSIQRCWRPVSRIPARLFPSASMESERRRFPRMFLSC